MLSKSTWTVVVLLVIAAVFTITGPAAEAQTEVCNAGVTCAAGMCTATISPVSMLSVVHFFGIQMSEPQNTSASNCQVTGTMGRTCTMTGVMMCTGYGGINTGAFPVVVMATKSTMAVAPSCRFVMKIMSGYTKTGVCTINMADGLPVELLEFGVGDDESDESETKPTDALIKKKKTDE